MLEKKRGKKVAASRLDHRQVHDGDGSELQVPVQNANPKFGNSVAVNSWIPLEEIIAAKNKELTLVEFGKAGTSQTGDKSCGLRRASHIVL